MNQRSGKIKEELDALTVGDELPTRRRLSSELYTLAINVETEWVSFEGLIERLKSIKQDAEIAQEILSKNKKKL